MPGKYILYSQAGAKTAKLLAKRLGFTARMRLGDIRADYLIRYGSTERTASIARNLLNKKSSIALSTHKLNTLIKLSEVEDIKVPTFWTNPNDIPMDAFPVLARKTNHTHGSDILLIMQPRDFRMMPGGYSHFVQYIPKKAEYRAHVTPGNTFLKRKVIPNEQADNNEEYFKRPYLWNYENGHVFNDADIERPRVMKNLAGEVCDILNLDFGAVDIIEALDGSYYILEVNSAPSLKTLANIDMYARPMALHFNVDLQELTQEDLDNAWNN